MTEFFLPRDFGEFCVGCTRCFGESETKCPHYEKLSPITKALDDADVIILASPVGGKKKQKIEKKLDSLARNIRKRQKSVRPSVKTRAFFTVMSIMQRHGFNKADADYWAAKGWTGKKRPWKS